MKFHQSIYNSWFIFELESILFGVSQFRLQIYVNKNMWISKIFQMRMDYCKNCRIVSFVWFWIALLSILHDNTAKRREKIEKNIEFNDCWYTPLLVFQLVLRKIFIWYQMYWISVVIESSGANIAAIQT